MSARIQSPAVQISLLVPAHQTSTPMSPSALILLLVISSSSASFPMNPTLTTMVLITFLPLLSFSYSTFPSAACLRSCSTCKQMYGGNFKGHLCARSCLQSMGSSWRPVCTDLPSITSFLDLSSLATFRWADDEI